MSVIVEREIKVFEMESKSRQRVCVTFKTVRKSAPSRRTGVFKSKRGGGCGISTFRPLPARCAQSPTGNYGRRRRRKNGEEERGIVFSMRVDLSPRLGDTQWPINPPPTTVLLSFTFIPPGRV